MKIANGLKQIRKMLRLSQEKMAGNILTKSYYSKIERGEFEIKACDLVKILELHDIKPSKFFSMLEKNNKKSKYDYYIDALRESYYENDLIRIQKVVDSLKNEHHDRRINILLALAVLLEANLEGNRDRIPISEINTIKNLIFETDNWDKYSLCLFSMSMNLFNIEELNVIMRQILDKCHHYASNYLKKFMSAILVNYLDYSFRFSNQNTETVWQSITQLKQTEPKPKNCFTLIMGKYYESLLNKDYKRTHEIINFLQQIGMNDFVKKMYKK